MLQPDPNDRFRSRRQQARRRRAMRRITAVAILVTAAAVAGLGATTLTGGGDGGATEASQPQAPKKAAPKKPTPRPAPEEIRGVHVTMALMTLPGKFDEYLSMTRYGLNTIQLDVKDENGEVAFRSPYAPLARRLGIAQSYYRPKQVARKVHSKGLYLVARVVVFEDPSLTQKRPDMAIQRRGGGVWTNHGGLGWSNQYDERVWDYNVDIAESAARAGFDEVMFDYVRFPTDGPMEEAVWPRKVNERKGVTIARFLEYARERLSPLGVRVSAAVFGLAATRDLGIGQRPHLLGPHLDAIYPMVYPSHYGPGEYGIQDPNGNPGAVVTMSLRHFRRALMGLDTKIVPWLQDFSYGRTYTLADVQAQVEASRRLRTGGFLLWNAGGVYQPEALAAPSAG
jgi:hypothetical protein